nr:MAG TPA: hypothetical protein [Caudoviricetes sp.]
MDIWRLDSTLRQRSSNRYSNNYRPMVNHAANSLMERNVQRLSPYGE